MTHHDKVKVTDLTPANHMPKCVQKVKINNECPKYITLHMVLA